jgi:hypothetical protein
MNNETIIANARAEGLSVHQYLHRHYLRTKGRIAEASKRIEQEARQTLANDWHCPPPQPAIEAPPEPPVVEPGTKMGMLAKEICAKHGVTLKEMRTIRRFKKLTTARQEFCWRAYDELGFSMTQVGNYLRKDHTTVVHAVHKHRALAAAKEV